MHVTIKDIARTLQVSPAAISLALNGKPGVSETLRQKILQKAEEMQYISRYEHDSSSRPIIRYVVFVGKGSVVNSISFHSLVLKGLEGHAHELGYNVLISYLYEDRLPEEHLGDLLQNVSGLVVLGTEFQEDSSFGEALCRIDRNVCPVIILDYPLTHTSLDCIATDNFYGAFQAVSYLIQKGHRQIGYFSSTDYISNFGKRAEGVAAAVEQHPGTSLIRIPTRFSTRNAFTDISAWLRSEKAGSLPTAFFADSDIIAIGAMQAFSASGIQIPRDVSIIGFDDMPECDLIFPPLTTTHVAKEKMGVEAMLLMDRRIRERGGISHEKSPDYPALHISISTTLRERSSVSEKNQ